MRSIVHISKFVVNINLIIIFNPNIYIFSVVAGVALHFYSGLSVNDLAGYDYYALGFASQAQAKIAFSDFRIRIRK